jgi:hypothetical protein
VSIVRVKSQICHGTSQNDRCSTNPACGCLHMTSAADTGICSFLNGSCSELISCKFGNNDCYEPGHICVRHPQCFSDPVCYPVSMIDQQICPPITSKRTTSNRQIPLEFHLLKRYSFPVHTSFACAVNASLRTVKKKHMKIHPYFDFICK